MDGSGDDYYYDDEVVYASQSPGRGDDRLLYFIFV